MMQKNIQVIWQYKMHALKYLKTMESVEPAGIIPSLNQLLGNKNVESFPASVPAKKIIQQNILNFLIEI